MELPVPGYLLEVLVGQKRASDKLKIEGQSELLFGLVDQLPQLMEEATGKIPVADEGLRVLMVRRQSSMLDLKLMFLRCK